MSGRIDEPVPEKKPKALPGHVSAVRRPSSISFTARHQPRPEQLLIQPGRALREFPPQTPSADSLGEAEADDRFTYFVKGDAHGRRVRASEWICSHLAEAVHLAAPTCAVIEMSNNERVFGSRKLIGVSDLVETKTYLITPSTEEDNRLGVIGLGSVLSAIYAFDMFLFNDDRHAGNYLTIQDGNIRRLYTFDYSRALFWNWPLNGFPGPTTNTRKIFSVLKQIHGFSLSDAEATLDRLHAISSSLIQDILNRMPKDWIGEDILPPVVEWWSSDARTDRIEQLRGGLRDGSLV